MHQIKKVSCYLFFLAALALSSNSFGQAKGTIGLGVKAGDPTGLSVKFYQAASAIEVVVGRPYYFSSRFHDHGYYHDRFYKNNKLKGYHFDHYTAGNPVAVQIHFLKHKKTKAAKELQLYVGLGPQLRAHRVHYHYHDDHRFYYTETATNIDLGLDGVFGLEYTFSDLPLSIFADANLFLELVDDLGLGLQGGLGVRYNLK